MRQITKNDLTMIVTVMQNRRDVPKPLKDIGSVVFKKSDYNDIIRAYVPKKGNNVLFITGTGLKKRFLSHEYCKV